MYKSQRYVVALYALLCVGAAAATGTIALNDSGFASRHRDVMQTGDHESRSDCAVDVHALAVQFRYGNAV